MKNKAIEVKLGFESSKVMGGPAQIYDVEGSPSPNHETLTASSPPIREIDAAVIVIEGSPSPKHETLNQWYQENSPPPQPTLHPDYDDEETPVDFKWGANEGFFLGAMDIEELGFNLDDQSFFNNNTGKRPVVVEDDDCIQGNKKKKLRINNINNDISPPPLDFEMWMGQLQQVAERARLLYEEKQLGLQQSKSNQQMLISELQKRDSVIEELHKTRLEEMQKRDSVIEQLHKTRLEEMQKKEGEIYRLEHELFLMGDVAEGYRKALKDFRRKFSEYREKARVPEEPTYKDTGDGGLMLTSAGIDKHKDEELQKKELEFEQNQQMLINELQKRDCVIDTQLEELQNKDAQIYQLQKELDLVKGYRNEATLKESRRALCNELFL